MTTSLPEHLSVNDIMGTGTDTGTSLPSPHGHSDRRMSVSELPTYQKAISSPQGHTYVLSEEEITGASLRWDLKAQLRYTSITVSMCKHKKEAVFIIVIYFSPHCYNYPLLKVSNHRKFFLFT